MGEYVTDTTQTPLFLAQAGALLVSKLGLFAASGVTPTLLLLVQEELKPGTSKAQEEMDEVEQVVRSDLRRSDLVLRCGPGCCAVLLVGVDEHGARCVARRLHQVLCAWAAPPGPYSLGLVSLSGAEREGAGLVALALEQRRPFLPVPDAALFSGEEPPRAPAVPAGGDAFFGGQFLARATRPGKARKVLNPLIQVAPERAEVALARARARELGVPYLAPPQHIPSSVRKLVPLEVMRQYRCLPVGRDRGALTVALADPTDAGALSCLEQVTGLTIFPVMTDPAALADLTSHPHARRVNPEAAPT